MRLPPPTTKDVELHTVMATLPNFHQSSLQMSISWQLGRRQPIYVRALVPEEGGSCGEVRHSKLGFLKLSAAFFSPSQVALGHHEEEYFSGPEPKAVLKKFREELAVLDKEIEIRNAKLDMPYEYLKPSIVENSVTI